MNKTNILGEKELLQVAHMFNNREQPVTMGKTSAIVIRDFNTICVVFPQDNLSFYFKFLTTMTTASAPQPSPESTWFVYMVQCADSSYYTGVTTDLKRRLHEHNSSTKGAKYTRCRRPVALAYHEIANSRTDACKREYAIKKLTAKQKKTLITGS